MIPRPAAPAGLLAALLVLGTAAAEVADPAACPERVSIRADQMVHSQTGDRVEVIGNVEISRTDRVLRTERAVYHREAGRIEIPEPFSLTYPDGDVIFGSRAEFDDDFSAGQVDEVRARLDNSPGELRGSALTRVADSFTLHDATYSPCPVSDTNPLPIWRVRASRVEHDVAAQDLVYRNPVFEIAGLPVLYLPLLRQPDPTVERRSGFLIPEMRTGSAYGFGVRVPYHFALAPDRDANITLFYTSRDGAIVEGQYRRLFRAGDMEASGSVSHDRVGDGRGRRWRGHLFLRTEFMPATDWLVGAEANLASQRGYLRRFDYSDQDRLRNQLYAARYSRSVQIEVRTIAFQTHRDQESNATLPYALPDLWFNVLTPLRPFGGDWWVGGDVRLLRRRAGLGLASAGIRSEWERNSLLPLGAFLNLFGSIRADGYSIQDLDGTTTVPEDNTVARVAPQIGAELSWPFIRLDPETAHTIEPFTQAILAPNKRPELEVPNEDSIDVEFDEFSLTSRNRFTGRDRIETGGRVAVGVRYGMLAADGNRLDAVAGQVFRPRELTDFTPRSGLRDRASDYVGAWGLRLNAPLALRLLHRVRLARDLDMQRNDVSYEATWRNLTLDGTFVYLKGDPDAAIGSPERFDRAEVQSELSTPLDRHWSLILRHRGDMENDRSISIGSALEYLHPCFRMNIDINREYTDSVNSPAGTTVSLSFELLTFGGAE